MAALADENPRVRESAAIALGNPPYGGRAVPALTKLLKDPDKRVADQAAEALVRMAGDRFATLETVGSALYASADYKRAAMAFEKQIEKFSDVKEHEQVLRESRLRLAKCYHRLKDWPKAIESYEALLPQYPKDADIRVGLGQCLREARQFDRALEWYGRWLQEMPEGTAAWWQGRLDIVGELLTQKSHARAAGLVDEFEKASSDLGGPKLRPKFLELRDKAKAEAGG
jgi:tetratricopeptide (TPR) repeat protein